MIYMDCIRQNRLVNGVLFTISNEQGKLVYAYMTNSYRYQN